MDKMEVALALIARGVLAIDEEGRIWKKALIRNNGKSVQIAPKRAETKIKNGYLAVSVWANNQ